MRRLLPSGVATQERSSRVFRRVVAWRWPIVVFYALLLALSTRLALRVGQDNSIDRLIVATDPDYVSTHQFQQLFGGGEYALLLAEVDDPFAPAVLERIDRLEQALGNIPHVEVNSALSVFRRTRTHFNVTPEQTEAFRAFATGTDLFRRQGLVGDHFLAVGFLLDVHGTDERHATLEAVDRVIAAVDTAPTPLRGIHRLGQPYVNVYLDETQRAAPRSFVLFAVFAVALNLFLYRSLRTLVAFLATLGVCLATSMGYIGLTGGSFTIVSPMVPMTVLVTATATLVYLHSRFVDRPIGRSVDEQLVFALANKFVPCTASIFATAVGFAALSVSAIRPIREMGLWVAVGLAFTWVIAFTLFPALQRLLRTPTREERRVGVGRFGHLAAGLPAFSHRWRRSLVLSALALATLGSVALFGLPGVIAPMRVLTDPLEYIGHDVPLYRDMKTLQPMLPGLSVTQVWLRGGLGSMSEPDVLTGLHRFQQALEADPDVGAAIGPTTILRMMRYIGGAGDGWPDDAEAREQLAADLEGMVAVEPMLRHFVQPHSLAQAEVTVISRVREDEGFRRLDAAIRRHWQDAVAENPALRGVEARSVGLAPLQAKMAQNLVPTLAKSFVLTVAIIFATFLLVFRSGTARIMAMIPSLFAILVMFGVMRITGMALNVGTILIASTVLGTSENDQVHFFYHFQEGRRAGTVEQALTHTLLVAGRAIFYATMINAGGFLAFGLSDLPPLRQFGVLAALAFFLSMVADFTALPAALWMLSGEEPDAVAALKDSDSGGLPPPSRDGRAGAGRPDGASPFPRGTGRDAWPPDRDR